MFSRIPLAWHNLWHQPVRSGADWLSSWDPENNWDSQRAWKTLWVTTFNLTLAFATWFLVSAIAPKLNQIGFDLSKPQLNDLITYLRSL